MLMSYWDGGYITLDVSTPAQPEAVVGHGLRAGGPCPRGVRADDHAGGQRAPGRVHARQQVHLRHRRGLRRLPRPVARSAAARRPTRSSPRSRAATPSPINKERPLVGHTRFLGLGCEAVPAAGARPDRGRRARRLRLPGQARQHRSGGLQGPDRLQPHGRGRLRDARVSMLAASETTPAIFVSRKDGFRLLGVEPDGRLHVQHRGRPRARRRPRRPVRAGEHLRRLRRLGLHAHVPDRPHARARRCRRSRFYAPQGGPDSRRYAENYGDMSVHEVAADPDQQPRLRLALCARPAGAVVQRPRAQGGRRVRRGGRLELLGRRDPQARRQDLHPRVRPRPRVAPLHVRGLAIA